MSMTLTARAHLVLDMKFTGTDEELLVMVEEMHGQLDSRDLGDALGAIIEMTTEGEGDLTAVNQRPDGTFAELTATIRQSDEHLFEWTGI